MEWLENVWTWLNNPLPVVGISVLMLGLIALKFFASTSVGKRAINQFKEVNNELAGKVNDIKRGYEDLKKANDEFLEESKNEIANLKQDYENQLKTVYSQFDYFEKSIFKSLEEIPNAKVKAEIEKFKAGYEENKKQLGMIANDKYELVQAELENMKNQMFEQLNSELEAIKNEAKERIDNQTKKE